MEFIEIIKKALESVSQLDIGREHFRRVNITFEINPTGEQPIYLTVNGGKFNVDNRKPMINHPDDMVPLRASEETLREIFQGKLRIVDASFDKDLIAPVYGKYSYLMAWLARLLRIAHRTPLLEHKY